MLALLMGLFAAPMGLLWLGHRLRRRTAGSRGVFWGAVAGHTLGMLASVAAMHVPAVPWAGGDARTIIVHWGMLVGAVGGAAVGWMAMRSRAGVGSRAVRPQR
jgi:hypothetical protein